MTLAQEMHWVLVRLLKVACDAVPAAQIRAALDGQLTEAGLRAEAEFMRARGGFERPYGWGWALALATTTWSPTGSPPTPSCCSARPCQLNRRVSRTAPAG